MFVHQSTDDFYLRWPEPELLGFTSLVSVDGKQLMRLRAFIVNTINKSDALARITQIVQPFFFKASDKGIIKASVETKVTLKNICMLFVNVKSGSLIDKLDYYFDGLLKGLRAYPLNFPGMAFHHALQCRRKLKALFQAELEAKKKKQRISGSLETIDLMDGLMQDKDAEGNKLHH